MTVASARLVEPLRFRHEDFDAFARLSGDDNPIHVDPQFAARTRFGRPVAHGMLLFAALLAATRRWLGGERRLIGQDLVFPAPTFAGPAYELSLEAESDGVVAQRITGPDGDTAVATAYFEGAVPPPVETAPRPGGDFAGLRVGMAAEAVRSFTSDDVAELAALVGDPAPEDEVPAPLLGGAVSHLLGTRVPGPGTNWLKQQYRFAGAVPVGVPVSTRVEIVRLRPEKRLVDLATTCTLDGHPAVSGRALVLARDVAAR